MENFGQDRVQAAVIMTLRLAADTLDLIALLVQPELLLLDTSVLTQIKWYKLLPTLHK
jgi:hypothetical protein